MKIRILATLALLSAAGVAFAVAGPPDPMAAQADASWRPSEAIVLSGADLPLFDGASELEIWAWSWDGSTWRLVAEQLDERNGATYVETEDGMLDADDELVLMLDDAGMPAPEGERPAAMPEDAPRAVLKISDPMDEDYAGEIHLFRSESGPEIAITPRLRWEAGEREIVGEHYRMGPADAGEDGFFGLRSFFLTGVEEDLVDRMKLRGNLTGAGAVNEETLSAALGVLGIDLSGDPVKVGPLRGLLEGGGEAYDRRFTIFAGTEDLAGLGGGIIQLTNIRVSLDFTAAVSGATYHDANLPAGVTVDGSPDAVPDAPVPAWREIRLGAGRLSLLSKAVDASAEARVYYRDDTDGGSDDTGDGMAYADTGVTAPDIDALLETGFPGDLLVLPAGAEPAPERLIEWRENPVTVEIESDDLPDTPTPEPTATGVATETPTEMPTGEPSPTAEQTPIDEPEALLYLPFLERP